MDTNYFVCTLGQAATLTKENRSYTNVNDFIDLQARLVPDKSAVGFFNLPDDRSLPWNPHILTFSDVRRCSILVASLLSRHLPKDPSKQSTVALFCPSSADFLFVWLALMRLGHAVLLIAPQCQPPAISHLCRTCDVSVLLYDEVYHAQAQKSINDPVDGHEDPLNVFPLSSMIGTNVFHTGAESEDPPDSFPQHAVGENSVAYLHHTSGTSSGLPKPIPQSHRAAVCVLPHVPEGAEKATFTTTPLYHGGIADLFRAWTSDALIWLFPGKEVPITAANVNSCLETANLSAGRGETSPVTFFSSVPYVLQMMEADRMGLGNLKAMDIVGVGGAALPAEVGDRLVEEGVNLVSRYGSAECGFVMSSHRDYKHNKDWQYLRSSSGAEFLRFEKQDDGTSELVILPGWPHMAKTNREDGSFATADLLAPHPETPHAWKYHSRADSQLTLITGKKFDPAPLEAAIAASPFLDDALIFGNGRAFPGALLFRTQDFTTSDTELIDVLMPLIVKLNEESQDHARIPRNMLVPMPFDASALEKSSKGTVMRKKAEEKYAHLIDQSYTKLGVGDSSELSDNEVPRFVTELVESVVPKPKKLAGDDDLFAYGVDSVACMQIRYGLSQLLPEGSAELPLSIVEDCGTVERLSEFMIKHRHGESYKDNEDEHDLMLRLAEKYSAFEQSSSMTATNGNTNGEVVVLTGATGALGAHILNLYRNSETTSTIYCLVRGSDEHAARERVNKALIQKGFPDLTSAQAGNDKVVVLQSQLGESNLGLPADVFDKIAAEATIIMHVAWSVNFRMRLRSFEKDNIAGVLHLINLALRSPRHLPPRFAYCSSVASAMNHDPRTDIPEQPMDSPTSASPLGYSRSKWVAENICHNAHRSTRLRSRIAVFRVGQLSGDTQKGIWNTQEAWPMMLSTARLTGCLPALENEPLSWLPVDTAAAAFAQAVESMGAEEQGRSSPGPDSQMRVYHIVNEHTEPDWMQLLAWLRQLDEFEVVPPPVWLERLEKSREELDAGGDHPALKLLGLWKDAYGEASVTETTPGARERPTFAMEASKRAAPVLAKVRPVDEEYVRKIWAWLRDAKMV